MRPRNEALHAEVERIANLKVQMTGAKDIAEKYDSTTQTVRALISRRVRELRKFMVVNIPRGT